MRKFLSIVYVPPEIVKLLLFFDNVNDGMEK